MPYTPVGFVDGSTPLNAANLNHVEDGVEAADQAAADAMMIASAAQPVAEKGQVNGYPSLDATGKVPAAQLPPAVPTPVDGQWLKGSGGAMIWDAIDIAEVTGLQAALDAKQALAQKAQANGYASLGADGRVPAAQLPAASALPARLGVAAQTITDWNSATENGWYMGSTAANGPPALGGWALGIVSVHNPAWITQDVYDFTAGLAAPVYRRQNLNGTWSGWIVTGITQGYGTGFPGNPTDGQMYTLVDNVGGPSYQWQFRYNGSSGSGYKWEFIGGTALFHEVPNFEQPPGSTYSNMGVYGPAVTVPRAGEYEIAFGAEIEAGGPSNLWISPYLNAAAIDADAIHFNSQQAFVKNSPYRVVRKTLGAAWAVVLQYRYENNGSSAGKRHLAVRPVKVA